MISQSLVRSAQTMQLSCAMTNINLQRDWNKLPLDIYYLVVPSGVPKAISITVEHSAQTVHLSCAEIKTNSKQIELSFRLIHIT
jgi:hypothetical protein